MKVERCDLLSFFELSLIDTNQQYQQHLGSRVVICFRSLNYLWLIPTHSHSSHTLSSLWFAFVLWIIFDWYQRAPPAILQPLVVICFRSLNYLWLIPTFGFHKIFGRWLWFAFVLWIIFDWYQLILKLRSTLSVVICFRSLNYLWLIPTVTQCARCFVQLWFAFVLWIIFDWYQPVSVQCHLPRVVICFRSLNYLWLIPTFIRFNVADRWLWFAFVLWIIFDWYQHR